MTRKVVPVTEFKFRPMLLRSRSHKYPEEMYESIFPRPSYGFNSRPDWNLQLWLATNLEQVQFGIPKIFNEKPQNYLSQEHMALHK